MKPHKVNILWIEDNPLLSERNSAGNDGVKKIKVNHDEFIVPSMRSLAVDEQFFNLKILQHPEEIKEYLVMCEQIIREKGPLAMQRISEVIPDIIVFDYMLSDNFNTSGKNCISYSRAFRPIRAMFNPTYCLQDEFMELFSSYKLFAERSVNYKEKDFFMAINTLNNVNPSDAIEKIAEQDMALTTNDEFGLFAGVAILRFFKDNITCALPATFNKGQREQLQPTAKYYEWLHSYDLDGALQRVNKGNKEWRSVLTDGTFLLRNRIEEQISIGKVRVSYATINSLSIGKFPENRCFHCLTIFGEKILPLDGMFLNFSDAERTDAIKEWALKLMRAVNSGTGISFIEYNEAVETSRSLLRSFRAVDELDKRERLSELIVKLIKTDLDPSETEELEVLKEYYTLNDEKIKNFINKKGAESSNLETNIVDYRLYKTNNTKTDRLIVLFSDLRLHAIYQGFCQKAGSSNDFYLLNQLSERPTYKELRQMLFAIPKNPLVLPHHERLLPEDYQKKDPFEVWDNHLGANTMREDHIFPKSQYPANLSTAESYLCRSFAYEIGLETFYYPKWLKM